MADRKIVSNARPPLHPDDVENRSFSSSFRGVDGHEVRDFLARLAGDLRSNEMEKAELAREIDELRRRLAEPAVITEDMVTAWLGEEAARILKSAQEAAADIRARAETETDRLRSSTAEAASNLHREAHEVLGVRTAEARQAAEAIVGAAQADAVAILEQAKAAGRELLQEAQSLRAKVLDDLARRRRIGQAQLDELRTGRNELLDAYAVVAHTLEEVTVRLRAIETAEPALDGGTPQTNAAIMSGLTAATGVDNDNNEVDELADRRSGALRLVRGDDEPDEPVVEREPAFDDGEEAVAILRPLADEALRAAAADAERERLARNQASSAEDQALVDLTEALTDATLADARVAIEYLDSTHLADGVLAVSDDERTDTKPGGEPPQVDELFARIRATRADAVARAEEVLAEAGSAEPGSVLTDFPVEAVPEAPDEPSTASEPAAALNDSVPLNDVEVVETSVPVDEVDEAVVVVPVTLLEQRDATLDKLTPALMKRIKRALHDQQNETLDALRIQRGRVDESALPASEQLRTQFTAAFGDSIRQAAEQGAASVRADATVDEAAVVETVAMAVELIAQPLDARLRSALKQIIESGEDVEKAAVRSVGAAYREWKSARIDEVAGSSLAAAWTRGVYEASIDSDLMWLVDDGTMRCPDCDDNALTDSVRRGEAFPTGHQYPPAHPGCRCLLAPSEHEAVPI